MLVSFITPAYNAERTIGRCIDSILKQDVGKEVIVVDNASSDGTRGIIKKYGKDVKYVYERKRGEPCARNAGLDAVKGDYIAFVDSDVVLPKGWAKKALSILKSDEKIGGVGGLGRSADDGIISRVVGTRIYGLDESVERKEVDSIATMNLLLRRDAIGSDRYDESMVLGVDTEFNFRIRKKGYKLVFDRSLSVLHYHPTTIGSLAKKWYTYGKNYPYFCTKHREFRGRGFLVKILFMPVMLSSFLVSVVFPPALLIPSAQVAGLFIFYSYVGAKVCSGAEMLVFPFVHTIKQLAQLLGTMVGLKRML